MFEKLTELIKLGWVITYDEQSDEFLLSDPNLKSLFWGSTLEEALGHVK